ncbi:MAG: prepilin peptidase, partial [Bryobacteraceae bacterium]
MILEGLLSSLFGLLIGSFLNVCIHRMPLDLSVVSPRSSCPSCGKQIAWFDNVPVLSYALLRGRCRHCKAPISFRYPAVEFLTGAMFFLAGYSMGLTAETAKFCTFAAIQVALIFTDLEHRILPDEFTLGGIAAGLLFAILVPFESGMAHLFLPVTWPTAALSLAESVLGAAFTGLTLWFVGWLYEKIRRREGLGLGDVKMVAMIGAFLGVQRTLLTLIAGSLLGSLIGLLFIL